jgi:hypothetical protein
MRIIFIFRNYCLWFVLFCFLVFGFFFGHPLSFFSPYFSQLGLLSFTLRGSVVLG